MSKQILKDIGEIRERLEELRDQWKEEIRTTPQTLQAPKTELYFAFQGVDNSKSVQVFQFDRLVKELASCDEPELKECGEKLAEQYDSILHLAEAAFEDASFGRNLDFQMTKTIEDLRALEDSLRQPKEWSKQMAIERMMAIAGINNHDGFKHWAEVNQYALKPLSRKSHMIRIDNMPPELREKFRKA